MARNAALKDLLKSAQLADDGCETVASVINTYLITDRQKYEEPRTTGVFHPSDISFPCERYLQLAKMGLKGKRDLVDAHLQAIFDTGSAIHDMLQEWLGRSCRLYGDWRCKDCGECREACKIPEQEGCSRSRKEGGKHRWKFEEVVCVDPLLEIQGKADGIVALRRGKKVVLKILEAKSSNDNQWTRRVREGPDQNHVDQAHVYMHCWKLKHAVILYFNKNNSKILEFTIRFNKYRWIKIRQKLWDVKFAVRDKRMLPRAESHRDYGLCRNCGFKGVCWRYEAFSDFERLVSGGADHPEAKPRKKTIWRERA